MRLTFISLCFFLCCCTEKITTSPGIHPPETAQASAKEDTATFAEGCFWHSEIVFQSLKGVRDAVSGYTGGTDPHPDYEAVSSGQTGHAEAVQVYYNPDIISYQTLVQAFFASQNPTTLNRQGNDEGTQYRSAAYYKNAGEKQIIENEIKRLTDTKVYDNTIVTEVKPVSVFYPAEAYHQEYIANNPSNGYVQNVSIPEFEKFKQNFKCNYK